MEKIFEIVVYRRLAFVNEAYNETDRYNGGFLCGSRTSDNIFVFNGLIKKAAYAREIPVSMLCRLLQSIRYNQ